MKFETVTQRKGFNSARRTGVRVAIGCIALLSLLACGGGDPEPRATTEQAAAAAPSSTSRAMASTHSFTRVSTADKTAFASYFQFCTDGCQGVAIDVFADRSVIRASGSRQKASTVHGQVFIFNSCTGELAFASGVDENATLDFNHDLSLVSVRATLVLSDLASLNLPLSLDLHWSGGLLTTEPKTRTVTTVPGLKTVFTTSSGVRQSESVAGALVLSGVDLLSPANVTAGSGISGFVTVSKASTIEITRTH